MRYIRCRPSRNGQRHVPMAPCASLSRSTASSSHPLHGTPCRFGDTGTRAQLNTRKTYGLSDTRRTPSSSQLVMRTGTSRACPELLQDPCGVGLSSFLSHRVFRHPVVDEDKMSSLGHRLAIQVGFDDSFTAISSTYAFAHCATSLKSPERDPRHLFCQIGTSPSEKPVACCIQSR